MKITLLERKDTTPIDTEVEGSDYSFVRGLSWKSLPESYWTKTCDQNGHVYAKFPRRSNSNKTTSYTVRANRENVGIRPVLEMTSSEFQQFKGLQKVYLGEYPQSQVWDAKRRETINIAFETLPKTGKTYTYIDHYHASTELKTQDEYTFEGEKYITFITSKGYSKFAFDKKTYVITANERTWLKVEPIEWLVDSNHQRLISTKIIMAGIPFNHETTAASYENSYIKDYLENHLLIEMGIPPLNTSVLEQDEILMNYFLKEKKKQLIKRR